MLRAWAALAALVAATSPSEAAVGGRVLDADGTPVAGATVSAHSPESPQQRALRLTAGTPRPALATAATAADGSFRLEAAQPVAVVAARAPGFGPAAALVVAAEPVTLTLDRAPMRRGVIRGAGRALAGAQVAWSGAGGAEWVAVTGADGSYQVPDPKAWASGVAVLHRDFTPLEDGSGSDVLDRTLQPGETVEGTVRDERGAPVAGAVLWLDRWSYWPLGTTRPDGSFRVLHAPDDWTAIVARTPSLAGSGARGAGRVNIVAAPARSVAGTVRDAAGRPVAGASVTARSRQGFASALTDLSGAYVLDGLTPGRFHVSAQREGHTPRAEGQDPVDLRQVARARRDLVLEALPMLSGRVVDEAGRPVDRALVSFGFKGTPHIYSADPFQNAGEEEPGTRTGADGSFRLPLPEPADYGIDFMKERPLVVLKPGFAAGRAPVPAAGAAARQPVLVRLGRGVALSGRAVSPEGRPLAGVSVVLSEDGSFGGTTLPMDSLLASIEGPGFVTTGADGRFEVRVHPAVHHLHFRGSGVAPTLVRGHDPRAGQPLEVVLQPAAAVRGRVLHADGRPVPEVAISLSQGAMAPARTAATAADGTFEVSDLAPGAYELTAAEATVPLSETRMVEAPALDVQIVVPAGLTLRGRVIDGVTRQPVTAFDLSLQWPARGQREVEVQDAGGTFTVADVPEGALTLQVTAEGYAVKRMDDLSPSLEGSADLEVVLEKEAVIRGRVTDERKQPIAEASVQASLKGGSESASASTTDDGQFELRGLPAAAVAIDVTASGYISEKRTIEPGHGGRVEVTLGRGLSLAGEVVAEGAAVPEATVSARSLGVRGGHQSARTDARGRFKLEGLPPGRYTLSAAAAGKGRTEVEDVDPQSAGFVRLALEKARTAVLAGKVVGLTAPEGGLMAMVMAQGEDGSSMAMVDSTMAFRMEDAPSGPVKVQAQAMAMSGGSMRSSRSVDLNLAPGSETETVLEFLSDTVSGLVTRTGAPVPGVFVSFVGLGRSDGGTARTDARGAYEVSGLEPGPYTVRVSGGTTTFTTEYVVTGSAQYDIDITGGTVQGRVVRAEGGAPLRGVAVSLWRVGGEATPAGTETTNDSGAFTARSLREGRYRLTTSKAGFGQQVAELDVAQGGTAEVLLELSPAAGLTVAVVDGRDGRALEASVVVRDSARRIVANSHSGLGDDGTLNIPLADGAYLLSTSASGYGTVTVPVTAPSQGLRVPLTPGGTIVVESTRALRGRGRLIQPDGEEYVRCWCNGIAEIQIAGRRTAIDNVTPGLYTLEVSEDDGGSARKPVTVLEGQKVVVAIE